MLLMLFIGVADFGRVFSTGITLEASTRNAAERAAQEYLQLRREPTPPTAAELDAVQATAADSVCSESVLLTSGGGCPPVATCIHDNASELANYGGRCGAGSAAAPIECQNMHAAWPLTVPIETGTPPVELPWVEVRTCYHFQTTITVALPLGTGFNVGDVWLQRDRSFVVGAY